MHPDMQVMPQACLSITMYPQGKWNMPSAITGSVNRARHHNVSFLSCACLAKSAENHPICWTLWGLKGVRPEMQVMLQACQSIAAHSQGKLNMPPAIISTMDRDTAHHHVSFLSCAFFLPNLPKTSPSAGYYGAWKGCILTWSILFIISIVTRDLARVSPGLLLCFHKAWWAGVLSSHRLGQLIFSQHFFITAFLKRALSGLKQ